MEASFNQQRKTFDTAQLQHEKEVREAKGVLEKAKDLRKLDRELIKDRAEVEQLKASSLKDQEDVQAELVKAKSEHALWAQNREKADKDLVFVKKESSRLSNLEATLTKVKSNAEASEKNLQKLRISLLPKVEANKKAEQALNDQENRAKALMTEAQTQAVANQQKQSELDGIAERLKAKASHLSEMDAEVKAKQRALEAAKPIEVDPNPKTKKSKKG